MELREFEGADTYPPELRIGDAAINHTIIDWKSSSQADVVRNNSQSLATIPKVRGGVELAIQLMSPVEPAALELSVFYGTPDEIDPAGSPDKVINLMNSNLVTKSSSREYRGYTMDLTAAGLNRKAVIGIFGQYYADPSSTDRFTNTVGWVFSLEADGH